MTQVGSDGETEKKGTEMARRSPASVADMMGAWMAWQKAAFDYQKMWLAASEVVWRRSLQIGMGTMSPVEAARMVMEKPAAFALAAQKSAMAAVGGKSAPAIASAAVRPVGSAARANARRLGKRKG